MLQERAMITNLTIRQWTGQKHDKKISGEVDAQHGAKDAGKYTKWIVDKVELKPLSAHTGKVRDTHYNMTLPWGDNGDRLLPSRMFMKYSTAMRELKAERETLAKEFADRYPSMVAAGAKRLGSMYDPNDYPRIKEIEGRFDIELSFSPVPDAKDFRVDIGDEAVEEIKKNITQSVNSRQIEALKDCWARIEDVTDKIVQRLGDPEAIFRDTLIENARFVAEVIPDLNITDDLKLDQACKDLAKLSSVHPDSIRRSKKLRNDTCQAATTLLQLIHAAKSGQS